MPMRRCPTSLEQLGFGWPCVPIAVNFAGSHDHTYNGNRANAAADMRNFEDTTLWRISSFERMRNITGTSGFARLEGPTVISTTLQADLYGMDQRAPERDTLEVMAACMRHRESLLMYLENQSLVWPVTLFPQHVLYHSPRDMVALCQSGLENMKLMMIEPPGVRPPGHWMHERVASTEHYRALSPLLWAVALRGPRREILNEVGGTAAYRALKNPASEGLPTGGAMTSAIERLRRESASLREIASWPGMSLERASRLLNAMYLVSALMVTRSHPSARPQPTASFGGLFGGRKPKR